MKIERENIGDGPRDVKIRLPTPCGFRAGVA